MPSNLEEKLKKVINKNYVKVINTLDPKTMLTHLKETGILTVAGYDTYYEELNNMLTHGKTKQDINIRLLEILYTRDRWWIAFLKALHQCQLQKIIDILEGALSEKEVYQLRQDCRLRSNRRPPRFERRECMRDRPTSDSDSDLGSLTENAQYHSLPEPRSRRKISREADQEVTRQRRFRSDCYAVPDAMPQNDLSLTQESDGCVSSGYPQHPKEQSNPSDLHRQPHHQPFPSESRGAQTHSLMQYENGSSNHSLYRGSSQPYPGYRPTVGTTVLARSSSAPSGPQHSDELWHFGPRPSHNPSNAFLGSRQRGQGPMSSVQVSTTDPVTRAPLVSSDQARASEGGPRTSGQLDTQAFGPQADRPTSCNDRSSSAPLPRQEHIDVSINTPLRHVPMKLLTLLYRLDHNHKWTDLGSLLTNKFLSENHNKILTSNSEEPKTKQVLDFFKAAEGDEATLGRLITALQEMQRKDLLDDIKGLTGLTFPDEEDVINEHRRKDSWAGASSNTVDLDIPTPDIKPPNVRSTTRTNAINQIEQTSISSNTLPVTDPCRDEAKQSCIGTTEDEFSQSSFTGARSGMYMSNQIILSQLEEEKKLEEALKCENLSNQNRPVESPNEEHPTEEEHGNPPCMESDSSDENNIHQNSSNNADIKPKPELESKVINTNSSDSPNRDAVASANQQPKTSATPAATSSSCSPISLNATGNEAEAHQHGQHAIYYPPVHIKDHRLVSASRTGAEALQHGQARICHPPQLSVNTKDHSSVSASGTGAEALQHGQARICHPPQLSVHTKDQGPPTSEKLSGNFKASETVLPGQLPNFDQIPPVSLQLSGTSDTSQSIPGQSIAVSNNPNHLLGPDSGGTAGKTQPTVGDKMLPNNYGAQHETMPKTIADSSDDSISFTEDANIASKLISGQHSSSVEDTTPPEATGATKSLGSDLNVTSDGSVYLVGTHGSSILDETQRSTYHEDSQAFGERHILTMSEASECPSDIAQYENRVLEQSIYYVPDTNGCAEDFLSLGESVEDEGELASGHTDVEKNSFQDQGHSEAKESTSINGSITVPDVTATADSSGITPAADGTGVASTDASPPVKGVSASSTTGRTSGADGDTSSGNAGTSANANRWTSFSSVISSGLKFVKLFTNATDVNKFYST